MRPVERPRSEVGESASRTSDCGRIRIPQRYHPSNRPISSIWNQQLYGVERQGPHEGVTCLCGES